ncbi:MAG: hypothetical protein A2X40_05485 [Elusimicrobia bacterium GWC2_65_9]|nr:MAG: hypothetical protein A2X40_05485 [Elusimicrobia bacterium GWC2_65_9]
MVTFVPLEPVVIKYQQLASFLDARGDLGQGADRQTGGDSHRQISGVAGADEGVGGYDDGSLLLVGDDLPLPFGARDKEAVGRKIEREAGPRVRLFALHVQDETSDAPRVLPCRVLERPEGERLAVLHPLHVLGAHARDQLEFGRGLEEHRLGLHPGLGLGEDLKNEAVSGTAYGGGQEDALPAVLQELRVLGAPGVEDGGHLLAGE